MGARMTDLFDSMTEAVEERAAIQSLESIAFDEDKRHRCEVSWIMRAFYPRAEEAKEYFVLVEKHRGKEAADKLRNDCREAWRIRKAEESCVR
jgi:hypothetical protein